MKKFLETRGVRLCYTVTGEGKPIILMHGWGCNHTTLSMIEADLSRTMKVYNVDFPGFGESSEPPEVWGVEQYTEVIEDLCKAEDILCPTLLGHSFGGRVAILFSLRNKVGKLILTDAAGVKPKRTLKYYYKVYSYKLMKKLILAVYGKERGEQRLNELRTKKGSSDYSNSTPMMRAILSRVVNEDLSDQLHFIACPTLLLWGENDTATPVSDARLMERMIQDSRLIVFPNSGHYCFLENKERYLNYVNQFVDEKV